MTYRDPAGKQRKQFARTLSEARTVKSSLNADVARGEYRAVSRVTFAEYAAAWIDSYSGRTTRGLRAETLRDYRKRLGLDEHGQLRVGKDGKPITTGAVAYFGRMRLAEIAPQHIREFIAHTAARTAKGQGSEREEARAITANTVRLDLAPVRALFATALEDGTIRTNPCAGVRIAMTSAEGEDDDGAVKAPSPDEYVALLDAIGEPGRLFFEFLGETGLRIGEAVALTWADVDLGACRVQVRRRWYRGSFGPPKSRYGKRAVPISPELGQRLWAMRGTRKRAVGDADFLCVSDKGRTIDQSNLASRVLKPAARAAGIDWLGLHSLRHYCATALFRRGLNAKQVQMWMGHHSPAFTLATYVHLLPDDLPASPFGSVPPTVEAPGVGNTRATEATETDREEAPLAVAQTA